MCVLQMTGIQADAANLHADANFTAMIPDLRAAGMSRVQIWLARIRLHSLNQNVIRDVNAQFGTDIRY